MQAVSCTGVVKYAALPNNRRGIAIVFQHANHDDSVRHHGLSPRGTSSGRRVVLFHHNKLRVDRVWGATQPLHMWWGTSVCSAMVWCVFDVARHTRHLTMQPVRMVLHDIQMLIHRCARPEPGTHCWFLKGKCPSVLLIFVDGYDWTHVLRRAVRLDQPHPTFPGWEFYLHPRRVLLDSPFVFHS